MVWFTFTFLLGIPNGPPGIGEKSKKPTDKLQVNNNYTELDVSKPVFTCHIEYVLFPADPPKQIDVVCWDHVAKIYFEQASSAFKPLVVEDLRWIHFRVNHKLKLSTADVPLLHGHQVRIVVSPGNKKLGDRAKSDNVRKFYCPIFTDDENEFIRKQHFQPVSETLEDLQSVSFFKEHLTARQQLYITLDTTMETSENYTRLIQILLDLSNEYHDVNNERIPSPPQQGLPPLKNLLRPEPEPEKPSAVDKKDKSALDKKKEGPGDETEFLVPGENFFSGRNTFENCSKYLSPELPYLVNLIKVRSILTRAQAEHFNPLSIFLSHCTFLPADDLKTYGVTHLKFQYAISNEFLAESNLIPISDSIKLDFTRTVLTDQTDKTQLIHFLQTGGLRVNVFGNSYPGQRVRLAQLYDGDQQLANGRHRRKPNKDQANQFFLLGTAFADISSVLLQPHRVLFKCNLTIPPEDGAFTEMRNLSLANAMVVYEFYSKYSGTRENNSYLCRSSPSPVLTVSVRMGYSLTRIYRTVSMNANLFNRLFAVIYDKDFAISIIQIIENDTREILEPVNHCRKGVNVRRPLTKNHRGWPREEAERVEAKMTGFLIDSFDKIMVYVEGPLFGSIQQIWALLSYLKPSQGHVLFDSSLVFPERLYTNFLKYGGFLKVNLVKDVEIIWLKPRRCGSVSMPDLAWKALTCLNLLVHCKSIKTAIQNNLLPDSQMLHCLALEFGVPRQMCHRLH